MAEAQLCQQTERLLTGLGILCTEVYSGHPRFSTDHSVVSIISGWSGIE